MFSFPSLKKGDFPLPLPVSGAWGAQKWAGHCARTRPFGSSCHQGTWGLRSRPAEVPLSKPSPLE